MMSASSFSVSRRKSFLGDIVDCSPVHLVMAPVVAEDVVQGRSMLHPQSEFLHDRGAGRGFSGKFNQAVSGCG